jgi:hypothetical protein
MEQHDPEQPSDRRPPSGAGQPGQPAGTVSFRKPPAGSGPAGNDLAGNALVGGPFDSDPFGGAAFHTISIDGEVFRPGPATGDSALRRYLLTRALGRSVINTVQWSAVAILVIAALCWLAGVKVLAVLIGLIAVLVLVVRAGLSGLERRLSGARRLGPLEPQVAALVARTSRGLRRELRRVGLPGLPWAPLLIALRIIRPFRRAETLRALSRVDLAGVVPASRLNELQLLLSANHR